MKNIIILFFTAICFCGNAQEIKIADTIIVIKEVNVYAEKKLFVLKTNSKRKAMNVNIKGKSCLVSTVKVDKNKKYKINAVDFFFNYKLNYSRNKGFYVRPLLISSLNGNPDSSFLNNSVLYYITNNIKETIHIDLSKFNIEIQNTNSFFIGIEFVDIKEEVLFEYFNVTMLPVKNELNISFVKGFCSNCIFSPINLDEKFGLALKYNIYYK